MIRVTFLPGPVVGEAEQGERLLDVARRAGAGIVADCGGRGKCGSCLVSLAHSEAGNLSPPSPDEQRLVPGDLEGTTYRLACTARVVADVTVTIPPESQASRSPPRKPFTRHRIRIRPAVSRVHLDLPPPSGEADTVARRVENALASSGMKRVRPVPLGTLADFSVEPDADRCRRVTAALFRGRDVLQLRPGERTGVYGVALDLGTTSLVCFLCDLVADRILAVRSAANPQAAFGEDVISRIAAVQRDIGSLRELQRLLVREANQLIEDTAREAGVATDDLLDAVAVGNPTMQHLFLGMNPVSLGHSPYLPLTRRGGEVDARSLGLRIFPRAGVHLLPMLSGFIGADTLAALLTRGREFYRGTNLLVDVGTNGELVLARDGVLTATSCATGPVFEGAHIRSGMRAAPGAVERVWVGEGGAIATGLIPGDGEREGRRAAGVCGSGVISAVAALVDAGIVGPDGAFDQEHPHPRLRTDGRSGTAELVLVPAAESHTGRDVVLTQLDIRAVQLGKAALRAGIEILLRDQGIETLDRIYLAGTFGNYLVPADLVRIGMLPPVPLDHIEPIGNAAGDGARLALFSTAYRARAVKLAQRVRVVDLAARPDFQEIFVGAMGLAAELNV